MPTYGGGSGGAPGLPPSVPTKGKPAPKTMPSDGVPDAQRGRGGSNTTAQPGDTIRRGSGGRNVSPMSGSGIKGAGKGNGGKGGKGGKGGGGRSFNNPLYNPNTALSGKSLWQAGQALAQAQYGPTIKEDLYGIRTNNRQGRAAERLTAGYFRQLGQFVERSMGAERGIASGLRGQLGGLGSQVQGQLGGIEQGAQRQLSRYTPQENAPGQAVQTRGNTLQAPGMSALTRQIALQKSLGAQNTSTFRQGGALQGANYRGLAASNLGTYASSGEQDLSQIAQSTRLANEPILRQVAALRSQKGALAAADTEKLREEQITNALTRWGLGLKGKALNIASANDAARNALALRQQNINRSIDLSRLNLSAQQIKVDWARLGVQKQNYLATQAIRRAEANKKAAGSGGGSKALTTTENNTMQALLDAGAAALKHGAAPWALESGSAKGVPRVPATLVAAAQELNRYGFVTSQTMAEIRKMGIRNLSYNGHPVRTGNIGFTG